MTSDDPPQAHASPPNSVLDLPWLSSGRRRGVSLGVGLHHIGMSLDDGRRHGMGLAGPCRDLINIHGCCVLDVIHFLLSSVTANGWSTSCLKLAVAYVFQVVLVLRKGISSERRSHGARSEKKAHDRRRFSETRSNCSRTLGTSQLAREKRPLFFQPEPAAMTTI